MGVFLGAPDTIAASKAFAQEDSPRLRSMGAIVQMGASGVQCLHGPICEIHLPKVMGLVEVCSTVFPVGEPTS